MSVWKKIAIPLVCCLAFAAGALLLQAQVSLSDLWIRFPDGTIQTTAAHNCVDPNDPEDQMIRVGGICIDKYEASLWSAPTGGSQIPDTEIDTYCPDNGQPFGNADCAGFYARSVEGVFPTASITWFQAQQALANSGKRLPTSAEWQMAVSGTPDSDIECNVTIDQASQTGAHPDCVSRHGALDMVGNMWEWVADWDEQGADCEDWPSTFGDDETCLGRMELDGSNHFPGALRRGGSFTSGQSAGPFAVDGRFGPSENAVENVGFRGAR